MKFLSEICMTLAGLMLIIQDQLSACTFGILAIYALLMSMNQDRRL